MAPTLRLRDVDDADLPLFFEQQRDPTYDRMAAFTRKDPSDRAAFDAHWARIRANPAVIMRTIVVDGAVVGSVGSWVMGAERHVTYGIAREHWGRGLATEALRAFLGELKERPLHASVAGDNHGSRRVLEKCGFVRCGSEKSFANARGAEIDEVFFVLE